MEGISEIKLTEGKFATVCSGAVVEFTELKGEAPINWVTLSDFCILLKKRLFHEQSK